MTTEPDFLDMANLPADLLVLTPNRRLAAWLIRDHDARMHAQGASSWPRLNILPLDAWMQQWHEQICLLVAPVRDAHPRLLSPQQSALLWRQILEGLWPESHDIDGLVALAQQARNLIHRWRWESRHWLNGERFEQIQFATWHQAYIRRLQLENAIDGASLQGFVLEQGAPLRAGVPRHVFLHGFNDPDEPQLQHLSNWLGEAGIDVRFTTAVPQAGCSEVREFQQLESQFGGAIQWALQQRDVARRIGVVIPNLQQQRNRIRALCKHLWSLQPDATHQHWTDIINITAGQKLCDYPLVSQLQLLFRGLSSELSLQEWHVLLTSPYFCPTEAQWLQRDAFIQQLREQNQKALYLFQIKERWRAQRGDDATTAWFNQLPAGKASGKQPVMRWVFWYGRFVTMALANQGRSLESEEFQIQQRLLETVATLQQLGDWLGDIDGERFRAELDELLGTVQFQPQTETAQIQIMGLLEAAGLGFDRLWICECEAVNWPQSLNPNPLLSRRVQRALNMPGASPERELQYTSRLLAGFRCAAQKVVFSWGKWQGDTEHTLSALLRDVPACESTTAVGVRSAELIQHAGLRDCIERLPADIQGTAVTDERARGGSGIIKSQSLCAFKAFAEFRLGLRARDDLAEGIKATDRGSFLHEVMEAIWQELQTSDALQSLLADPEKMDAWLNNRVKLQMDLFRQRIHLHPAALYELEQRRALNIVRRWLLECDGARAPFTVLQLEKRRKLTIGGIELDLTVDRIDQLQDGSSLIVDYKTGDKNHKAWEGERPEEPQLPLYTLLESSRTQGILFGVLKPSALGYKGLVANPDLVLQSGSNTVKEAENWQQQMQEWHEVLEKLANEFCAGHGAVAPLNENACTYCHLAPVCRIKEVAHDSD